MQPGILRPLISANPLDQALHSDENKSVDVALRLLLYVHEVAIESDFLGPMLRLNNQIIGWSARVTIREVLSRLADLRPLVAQGLVHFTAVESAVTHPAYSAWDYAAIEQTEVRAAVQNFLVSNGLYTKEQVFRQDQINERNLAQTLTYFFGATKMALLRMAEGTAHPLTRNDAERTIVNALLSHADMPDHRRPLVDSLARLSVPDFSAHTNLLVRLRNNEDQFHKCA